MNFTTYGKRRQVGKSADATPNPSLERTSTGLALGPRGV